MAGDDPGSPDPVPALDYWWRGRESVAAWPLVEAEVTDRLGPGEWRPTLGTIGVLAVLD
jgi:hypothetical protein